MVVTSRAIVLPQILSKQSANVTLGKMGISAITQRAFNYGNINIAGVVADGFLVLNAGSSLSSVFEVNYNIHSNSMNFRSALYGNKTVGETFIEMGKSMFFGAKSNFFSRYLTNSKTLGTLSIDFANQIGNYGFQKGIKSHNGF